MIGALPLATIPPEDEALRPEIRAFLRETVGAIPPERRARSWMGFDPGFSQKLAGRGWLGLTFPKEYGGRRGGPSHATCSSRSCWPPVRRSRRTGSRIGRADH